MKQKRIRITQESVGCITIHNPQPDVVYLVKQGKDKKYKIRTMKKTTIV